MLRHDAEHASALQIENTMTEVKMIADFAPDNVEAGVGLALQDDEGRYLFTLLARQWLWRIYCAMP